MDIPPNQPMRLRVVIYAVDTSNDGPQSMQYFISKFIVVETTECMQSWVNFFLNFMDCVFRCAFSSVLFQIQSNLPSLNQIRLSVSFGAHLCVNIVWLCPYHQILLGFLWVSWCTYSPHSLIFTITRLFSATVSMCLLFLEIFRDKRGHVSPITVLL